MSKDSRSVEVGTGEGTEQDFKREKEHGLKEQQKDCSDLEEVAQKEGTQPGVSDDAREEMKGETHLEQEKEKEIGREEEKNQEEEKTLDKERQKEFSKTKAPPPPVRYPLFTDNDFCRDTVRGIAVLIFWH